MIVQLKKVTLVMWEKTDMPDSKFNETTKKYEKTGSKTEKTTYIFRDIVGDKLVFMGNNDYRHLEGKYVDLEIEAKYDEFNRKNKISLKRCVESQ